MMLFVFCLQHCVNGHLTHVLQLTLIDSLLTLIASLGSRFWVGLSANRVTLLTSQDLLITVRTTRRLKGSVGVHTHTHICPLRDDEMLTLAHLAFRV